MLQLSEQRSQALLCISQITDHQQGHRPFVQAAGSGRWNQRATALQAGRREGMPVQCGAAQQIKEQMIALLEEAEG